MCCDETNPFGSVSSKVVLPITVVLPICLSLMPIATCWCRRARMCLRKAALVDAAGAEYAPMAHVSSSLGRILPGGYGILPRGYKFFRGSGRGLMRHRGHPEVVKRLKRAEGHLRSVIVMIEEGQPCLDLAQQLQAIENAIANAKKALIHDHLSHCIRASLKAQGARGRAALKEFKAIAKYL